MTIQSQQAKNHPTLNKNQQTKNRLKDRKEAMGQPANC
jgi:hypothetical protein